MITEKTCKKCESLLSVDHFTKSKNIKDGYENTCKCCRNDNRKSIRKTCLLCESDFLTAKTEAKYCSSNCSGEARKKNRTTVNCSHCNATINKREKIVKEYNYCDQSCRSDHLKVLMTNDKNPNYRREEYSCDGCNKQMQVVPHRLKTLKHLFCSYSCYQDNIGKFYSGENNPLYNASLTPEQRLRTRRYAAYYEWRTAVYERDNYTCRCCGDNAGGNLIAHHIYNYSKHIELRTDLDNGITLCSSCHKDFHKENGYRNNNQEQIDNFIECSKTPIPR